MAPIFVAAMAALLVMVLGVAPSQAQKAYITNGVDGTVSVINTVNNTVTATITVGLGLTDIVAVTPEGSKVYVGNSINQGTNSASFNVFSINTASNTVIATIAVGGPPSGVAVSPDGSKVYVSTTSPISNSDPGTVSVISTSNNAVTKTITVGLGPKGVAVTPDGSTVYVANFNSGTVSVINTASNTVIATIPVSPTPEGVTVTPDGSTVYVGGFNVNSTAPSGTVSVISTSNNTVTATIPVGKTPFGVVVSPDGSTVYAADFSSSTVSVISTATNMVTETIAVGGMSGKNSIGVAVTPDGSKVYVPVGNAASVSVVSTASSTVIGNIGVGSGPGAFGSFIGPPTLTVAENGTGSGQGTSSPAGINCSASSNQCANMFPDRTQVTLTASAAAGSSFAGWSGGGCSGTGTCVITPTVDATVTATFTVNPSFVLSVATAGGGAGTVSSSPTGITCGGTCSASFQTGTQVALTATAANGSTFAGWSGGGCSGIISPCVLTLAANTNVTANFVADSAGNLTLVAAVLPTSRSVQIGNTATAFATIIDAGPADASTCTIAPATGVPASFLFQTTSVATNGLIGTANTPANIAARQAQSFVIALTPTAAFTPTNVAFTFNCANAPSPAATTVGVDTLNLSGSATPVPDVVALAASADPGYVDIPGATGTGVFAVATVNVGADATITAAANTGVANLPVTLALCQTNPTSGACLATPAPSVSTDIPPNATPTFGIFVTGSAAVANSPGVNRVFVTFTDAGGVLRGETSVAVRTQ